MRALMNQALAGLMNRVDRWQRAPSQRPTHHEESSRYPGMTWDLRTLIALFPPQAPFRFLNLNLVAGLTGLPFDRRDRLGGVSPTDAFDLQFCLQGRGRACTYKAYHSLADEVESAPDAVRLHLPSRLSFEGAWPAYEIAYQQPEDELELTIRLDSQPGFHWWSRTPGLYAHYTSFARATVAWKWQGEEGRLEMPLLHDHGWGRNLRALRWALRVFRYEVLRLPDGGHLITLACDGPAGLVLRRTGLLRSAAGEGARFSTLTTKVRTWETLSNYRGRPRRLPRTWHCTLGASASNGAPPPLEYEATLATAPKPLLGDGFLQAIDYRARGDALQSLGFDREIEGEGYAEQLGQLRSP